MAAARSLNMAFALAVLVATALFQSSEAASYVVGDATGWTSPTAANDEVYDNWAVGKTFYVGDVLVFNFVTGVHDVAQVTAQAADDCITTNPLKLTTAGPANITLTTAGMNYFICTKPGHCNNGQELKINVLAAAAGPGSSPGSTTTPSGSSPSSATSIVASAGVFTAILATAVAVLF